MQYQPSVGGRQFTLASLIKSLKSLPAGLTTALRKQKWMIGLSSPNRRNHRKLEIDISYRCNKKCRQCNRSSPQAPSREEMSVEQVQKFILESVERKIRWDSIMVLGGEPTLHPKLPEILGLLIDYRREHSGSTAIVLATNGVGAKVKSVLDKLPKEVTLRNSAKDARTQFAESYAHEPFNEAPQDSLLYRFSDFRIGCYMTSSCGTGLTPFGYYVCPIAGGGIDRVFGFDAGRKEIPAPDDQMDDQRLLFCRLCGHFKEKFAHNTEYCSPTWKEAYREFAVRPPTLSRY